MIKKRVSFYSTDLDNFGMPTTYRSYFIIGREAESGESANKRDGIAKVYILSNQAVALNPDHFVAVGGSENAVNLAIVKLRELNPGLNESIYQNAQP